MSWYCQYMVCYCKYADNAGLDLTVKTPRRSFPSKILIILQLRNRKYIVTCSDYHTVDVTAMPNRKSTLE